MHTFVDNAGRTWTLTINVAALKRVRGLLGVDLYKLVDDGFQPLAKLVSDPVQLADVLFCLCKEEAESKQLTDEDFGRALAGDAIHLAADAFVEELIDFFPDARARLGMKKVLDKGRAVREKLLQHAEVLIESLNVDHAVNAWLASSGSSRASSVSIQASSPSTNSS